MNKLSKYYYNPKHPASFGGVKRLNQYTKGYTANQIKSFLRKQDVYTKHKQRLSKFQRRKVMVPEPCYLFQADLIYMNKYKWKNNGFEYILTCIDCYSKYAWAIPLKNKKAESVIAAFQHIFEETKIPKYLQTDEGWSHTVFG